MKVNQLKNVTKIFTLCLSIFLLNSCANDKMSHEKISVVDVSVNKSFEAVTPKANNLTYNNETVNVTPKNLKIIKSAQAKYKVKDVKKVTRQIKKEALKHHAYISDLRFENNLYKKENRFTIKIPHQNFDIIMDSIGSFVEFVDYENITTQDVTEEYVDLETRLKTKLEVKERYESILRKNAKTVKDILLTEDKLRVLQEEIEAVQGRLKYLTSKVSYSTIQIDLYETVDYKKEPIAYKKTFGSKIKEAFSFGFNFIESLFIGLIHIWPLFIIAFFALLYFRKQKMKKD